ncbi:MAG: protein-export chaperone SecB, partial [Propionivibrio sp.]|nr:protein-export chaperone SecB [Propionivibrio sp.]
MTEQEAPSFAIEKLYVKDLSLEVPNAPAIYLDRETPEISRHSQTRAQKR